MIFTRNPFPFLVTPHRPHGSSRLLSRGHLLDKPWTIPLTSQAPGATMATAFPRLGWIPSQVRFGTRLGSLGIFRDCHWCHPHSCFLRGFLSAFPIAQPRSHLVEGGDPAWWSIRFLLDKCIWLLAVLFFFPQKKIAQGRPHSSWPTGFLSQAPGLSVGQRAGMLLPQEVPSWMSSPKERLWLPSASLEDLRGWQAGLVQQLRVETLLKIALFPSGFSNSHLKSSLFL